MSLLSDWEIIDHVVHWRERGLNGPMIENFEPSQVKHYTPTGEDTLYSAISWGTSSYGYDFRVGTRFKVFNRIGAPVIDPKNFNTVVLEDFEIEPHGAIAIPPHSFVLATTIERFCIPRNVLVQVLGKSTYARCGLILNVTPLEPEWEGEVTIELSNTTPLPLLVYACEGIGQALFHRQTTVCRRSYADKKGKYQAQSGITLAKV